MAIDDLLDEHEQSRRVQEWLRANGGGLLGGVLLGLAAIGGWKWWQQQQVNHSMQVAEKYQAAVDGVDARGVQAAAGVQALPPGIYRSLATFSLARAQVDAGQRDAAISALKAALPSEPSLRTVAERRIARLQIDAGKASDALKTLRSPDAANEEVRGDAYFALGQRDQAREAYRRALAATEVGAPQRRLIELKHIQVGGAPAVPQTP